MRLEPHALSDDEVLDAIPLRKEDHVWRELCQRVRERLGQFARRTEELEMARAAAEVRVRRIVAERDQLREILAGLTDPVMAVDQFGEIVLANPSAEQLLDVKAERRRASGAGAASRAASSSSACSARRAAAAPRRSAAAK